MISSNASAGSAPFCNAGEPWTMQRQPPYIICIYPDDQGEMISQEVRESGQWRECSLLPRAVREGIEMLVSTSYNTHHVV